jgi:hypothetical protein
MNYGCSGVGIEGAHELCCSLERKRDALCWCHAYGLSTTASIAGTGGGTPFGPDATAPGLNTGGIAAVNYGTGGSGVVVNQSGGNGTGGAGFSGVVVITEYA